MWYLACTSPDIILLYKVTYKGQGIALLGLRKVLLVFAFQILIFNPTQCLNSVESRTHAPGVIYTKHGYLHISANEL